MNGYKPITADQRMNSTPLKLRGKLNHLKLIPSNLLIFHQTFLSHVIGLISSRDTAKTDECPMIVDVDV